MKFSKLGLCFTGALCVGIGIAVQTTSPSVPNSVGRSLSPVGDQVEVGSFPINIAKSSDGRFLAVTNVGFREQISILDATSGKLLSTIPFNQPQTKGRGKESLYIGLAFGPSKDKESTLFASRGPEDKISILHVSAEGIVTDSGQALENAAPASSKAPLFVAGLALNADGSMIYIANNNTSLETGMRGSLSVIDVATGKRRSIVPVGGFPLAVAAVTSGPKNVQKVFVSNERDSSVSVVDATNPDKSTLKRSIHVGRQPIALLPNPAGTRLFVANSGSDSVSVVDTKTDRVIETISLRPAGFEKLPGMTPTGLSLNPDGTRLYVSLGDANSVGVLDISKPKASVVGFIPVGWYPTSVAMSHDGQELFVANAKGVKSQVPNGRDVGTWGTYIQNILEGTVSIISTPSDAQLARMTTTVLGNNRLTAGLDSKRTMHLLDGKIKHVVYIIKENRTYDQVFGDIAKGNGDPSLTLFGKDVTPNLHALAERFVLLDNFSCNAEVSGDGWDWSISGMASAYTVRNVPFNYSGRGRSYDFEGASNNVAVDLENIPDVAEAPSGYLWDWVQKAHLSYRNYGFYVTFAPSKLPNGKAIPENVASKRALVGHTDDNFRRFDLEYADSEGWMKYNSKAPRQKKEYGANHSPSRFSEWKGEFDEFVKHKNFPAFSMVRFPRDHTEGTTSGFSSPRAMVADNDYAVGQLVEAISKSPYWNSTAIFVVEDDAQDGTDHVDAHRSPVLAICPYITSGAVDHKFYNTSSILRTMQALLGIPPASQYDATAPILEDFGTAPTNSTPYEAVLPAKEIFTEVNTPSSYKALLSAQLDFSREDSVDPKVMRELLWHSVKDRQKAAR